ncbi:heme NO-binding domain-containing protein [Alcanivorax sp. S6407]|uniref:heme NO-binding domain-containing protein n=1 Tax=Alcanivorax sp. S6407 TaxID=2926424 RepID=UPI001FF0E88F|nr:heme NO-binding domain-containing protein [Alcanivorax sp. S6407]MCK0153718.1 heme NO-binding domain-containing protein [Alcanivorax sp. S6407]
MKGTITRCAKELVESTFGADQWLAILEDAKVDEETRHRLAYPTTDIDDSMAKDILASTAKVLGLTAEQVADAFGEHWCCVYAPKIYSSIITRFDSAREMILGMDKIHVQMTATIKNARPPRFDYQWQDDRTLIVTYKSFRGMIDIYRGLVLGVGKLFNEPLSARKLDNTQVEIVFG